MARDRLRAAASGLGEELDGERHDLFYIGGGQDRDQRLCAEDLIERQARRPARRRRARARSCSVSAAATSCSGTPTRSATRRSRASGCSTSRPCASDGPRLIGNVAIEPRGAPGAPTGDGARGLREPRRAHPPRRRPGAARARAARPRQRRRSGFEGARQRQHARHLPARPAAAEERVVRRLADRAALGTSMRGELAPLDDALEDADAPRRAARRRRSEPSRAARQRLAQLRGVRRGAGARALRSCAVELVRLPARSRAHRRVSARGGLAYPRWALAGSRPARSPSRSRSRSATTAGELRAERARGAGQGAGATCSGTVGPARHRARPRPRRGRRRPNLEKLRSRQRRGVLSGSGDDR